MKDQYIRVKILDGDPAAIATLQGWIRGVCQVYRSRLENDLEDVEQEVLMEICCAIGGDRFEGRSRLRTYVAQCVHHKCIDRLRQHRRRRWLSLDDLDLPAASPSPLDTLSRKERTGLALEVRRRLSPKCRQILGLLQAGLRYGEMSLRLGVSEVALRSRVLRCRRHALAIREKILQEKLQRNPLSDD